jgi:hypothetical protein
MISTALRANGKGASSGRVRMVKICVKKKGPRFGIIGRTNERSELEWKLTRAHGCVLGYALPAGWWHREVTSDLPTNRSLG